jgi:hypothetical protein
VLTQRAILPGCKGFIPAQGEIARRQLAPEHFRPDAVANQLRCKARGLFVSDYDVQENITAPIARNTVPAEPVTIADSPRELR